MNRHQQHLLHLSYIRTIILFVVCIALLIAIPELQLTPSLWLTGICLISLIALNLMTYVRLHSHWPVLDAEFFAQLCADVVIYAALLYQFGGASNPFVFVLLIPLIISATTLPKRLTFMMAITVAGLYTSLLFNHLPLLDFSASHQHTLIMLFQQHITALWISFLLTVGVISTYVVQMRNALVERDLQLNKEKERSIQDRQLLTLATLAAGTAHELRTPLSSMKVILSDLQKEHPEWHEDLNLMQEQVELCNQKLHKMAKDASSGKTQPVPVDQFIAKLLSAWQLMRPEAHYQLKPFIGQAPCIQSSMMLQQALINLLNNAADASKKPLEIDITTDSEQVKISIRDQGPGLTTDQLNHMGKPFFTTKGGLGIGLYLTVNSLASQEGEVRLFNHPQGGTLTEVKLPVCRAQEELSDD